MSRILFVVPPLTGHVNPTAAVGAELLARGHDVAWAGHPATITPLLPTGARVCPAIDNALDEQLRASRERWLDLRGAAALKFFWEDFVIPLAGAMLPGTRKAIEAHRPDVIIADQQALAGPVAARLADVPWVTSASTPAELLRPLADMPKVEEWISDQMAAFQLVNGVADPVDLRFSDRLTLVFTTPALMGTPGQFDVPGSFPEHASFRGQGSFWNNGSFWEHCAFTGPALAHRPDRGDFPWEWLDARREHVLVSLGTLNGPAGDRFFRVVTEALSDLGDRLQAVIVGPPVPGAPDHLLFTDHVPQLALLPHMNAVVSHGGHNTVCETLAGGLPLVVTPIRDDQPLIAQQVADAGAGIRLRFGRLRPAELRDALLTVLGDPSYRTAAARIGASFTAAGGAATAADHVENLL